MHGESPWCRALHVLGSCCANVADGFGFAAAPIFSGAVGQKFDAGFEDRQNRAPANAVQDMGGLARDANEFRGPAYAPLKTAAHWPLARATRKESAST
jgi:hypothetical protein